MEEHREMTVREAGKKGGETVKRKYGRGNGERDVEQKDRGRYFNP